MKTAICCTVLLLACVLPAVVGAETPTSWGKTYGSAGSFVSAYAMDATSDGGYILAGRRDDGDIGYIYLLKIDGQGIKAWEKSYNYRGDRNYHNYARDVRQTTDGGYILVASIRPEYDEDIYLLKTDSSGNVEWDKVYGGDGNDQGEKVTPTPDGGYAVVGSTTSSGAGGWDSYLLKTDRFGNKQWEKTYGGSDMDLSSSFQVTSDGGYMLCGSTSDVSSSRAHLVKVDGEGGTQWEREIPGGEGCSSVRQTSDGGYFLGGAYSWDIFVARTDGLGNPLWLRYLFEYDYMPDFARAVLQTSDGGFVVAGETESMGDSEGDMFLVKLDPSGRIEWEKQFGGPGHQAAFAVWQAGDGNYLLAGELGSDAYAVYYNPEDREPAWAAWEMTYGGDLTDGARSLRPTADGGYILAGSTQVWLAPFTHTSSSGYLLKTDGFGAEQWSASYVESYMAGMSVLQTPDGGYLMAGDAEGGFTMKTDAAGVLQWQTDSEGCDGSALEQTPDGGYILAGTYFDWGLMDMCLVKKNMFGLTEWARYFDGHGYYDYGRAMAQTSDGGYVIAGDTFLCETCSDTALFVVKTDANGDEIWRAEWSGLNQWGSGIVQTADGGYLAAGGADNGGSDVYLVKMNISGKTQWTKMLERRGEDAGFSLAKTADGGYAIAGTTNSTGAGWYDMYLLKVDGSGNKLWEKTFGGGNYDAAWSVREVAEDEFMLAGVTASSGAGNDDAYLVSYRYGAETPGPFGKALPADGGNFKSTRVRIEWGSADGADGYQYCVDTTGDELCEGPWTDAGTATAAEVSGLTPWTTYFWQVRATAGGRIREADGPRAWWRFTVGPDWGWAYTLLLPGKDDLARLRAFRDGVMAASAEGRELTRAIYRRSGELLWVLLRHPALLEEGRAVVAEEIGAVVDALGGRPAVVRRIDRILRFLSDLAAASPKGLAAEVERVRAELEARRASGRPFLGFTLGAHFPARTDNAPVPAPTVGPF